MLKIILDFIKDGGEIYYMDTDSLVTNKPLQTHLVGNKLGQFKLEYIIEEGYFISNKTYCLVLNDGSTIIKTKGVLSNSLKLEDFKNMYYNSAKVSALKSQTKTDYEKGSVSIEEVNVLLNYNSYTKREKIFNTKGLWVDSKPVVYKNENINKPSSY